MRYRTIIFVLFVFLSACSNNRDNNAPIYTLSSDTTAGNNLLKTDRGKELFQQRCMACHGLNGDAGVNKAANLRLTRMDSLSMAITIQNGRGVMPMFKNAIPDSDIAQIIIYIKTLRKG